MDNLCKTPCKSSCKSRVKNRVNLFTTHPVCVNHHFPTHFSHIPHQLSHIHPTSIFQLFYPLFHRTYYYNYNINILERN